MTSTDPSIAGRQRLLQQHQPLHEVWTALVQQGAACQLSAVGIDGVRCAARPRRRCLSRRLHLAGGRTGNLVLHGEDIFYLAIEPLAPDVEAVSHAFARTVSCRG